MIDQAICTDCGELHKNCVCDLGSFSTKRLRELEKQLKGWAEKQEVLGCPPQGLLDDVVAELEKRTA